VFKVIQFLSTDW